MGNEAHVRRENIIAEPASSVLEKGGSEHFVEGLCYLGPELPLVPCRLPDPEPVDLLSQRDRFVVVNILGD